MFHTQFWNVMKLTETSPQHEVAYKDLCELCAKHGAHVTASQMLAIAANMVGKLIAMQDARTMTPEDALSLVMLNIENGNRQIIDKTDVAGTA